MNVDGKIRVLIVDDEPGARKKIRQLLARHADVAIIGDCDNGYEAIAAIEEQTPDLVFLDVNIPGVKGFDVLDRIPKGARPLVILVTFHVEYALKGYDVDPVHFLLKPLDRKRFDEALRRAKIQLTMERESHVTQHRLARLEDSLKASSKYHNYLLIKLGGGRSFPLDKNRIDWVEAEEKYVNIHVGRQSYLQRGTFKSLEAELDPHIFIHINRSYIVNINSIKEIRYISKKEHKVVLRDDTELEMSDNGRKNLSDRLGISL
jgi:two-component system LytT family response regulator